MDAHFLRMVIKFALYSALAVLVVIFMGGKFIGLLILVAAIYLLNFLSRHLDWGWYGLVFLSLFFQWTWSLSFLKPWFIDWPWLYGAYAPAVEFWAVLMILAFGWGLLKKYLSEQKIELHLPGLQWFLLFLGSAAISLINLPAGEKWLGIKYIFHFILLFYFGYLVVGSNVVDSKKIWKNSLKILAGVGFLAALMGAASLVLGIWQGGGFHRVVPFSLWGWLPFGDQHIFLAESITTVLPIYFYFWHIENNSKKKNIWQWFTVFVLLVGLATLSRAGWITIFFEAGIFFYVMRKQIRWQVLARTFWWLIILIAPLFVYLLNFLTSYTVKSSTSARWYSTSIAWWLFEKHPLIGNGVGSFVNRLAEVRIFEIEFGAPTDALGIGQKLIAEQGVLGVITFSAFIAWILIAIWRRFLSSEHTAEARLAYFVSFFLVLSPLVFQLFNTQFYSSKMWVPIAIAISQSLLFQGETIRTKLFFNLLIKKNKIATEI